MWGRGDEQQDQGSLDKWEWTEDPKRGWCDKDRCLLRRVHWKRKERRRRRSGEKEGRERRRKRNYKKEKKKTEEKREVNKRIRNRKER